jgi:hypothetical protein
LAKLLEEFEEIRRVIDAKGIATSTLPAGILPAVENQGRLGLAHEFEVTSIHLLDLDAINVILMSKICHGLDKCGPVFRGGNARREPNTSEPTSNSNMGCDTLHMP